jgi:hypothetical protein
MFSRPPTDGDIKGTSSSKLATAHRETSKSSSRCTAVPNAFASALASAFEIPAAMAELRAAKYNVLLQFYSVDEIGVKAAGVRLARALRVFRRFARLIAEDTAGEGEDEKTIVVEDRDGMGAKIFKSGELEGALWIEEIAKTAEGGGDKA